LSFSHSFIAYTGYGSKRAQQSSSLHKALVIKNSNVKICEKSLHKDLSRFHPYFCMELSISTYGSAVCLYHCYTWKYYCFDQKICMYIFVVNHPSNAIAIDMPVAFVAILLLIVENTNDVMLCEPQFSYMVEVSKENLNSINHIWSLHL